MKLNEGKIEWGKRMAFKKLISIYEFSQVNYLFWNKELRSKIKVNTIDKLKMLRKGFHGESKIIYQLSSNNYSNYISDYHRLYSKFINKKYSFILNNKVIFAHTFKDFIKVPRSYALIEKGRIIPLESNLRDFATFIEHLNSNKFGVLKPISGGGGKGVLILKVENGEIYVNNKLTTTEHLKNILESLDDYFYSQFINQSEFSKSFNPTTLNSIRIVTMIDPKTNKAFIPIAVQRIGTNQSAPADNWTQGGISAEINIENGILGKGVTYPFNSNVTWLDKHPDTGLNIEGVKIPEWNKIKETLLDVANKFPYIKYVGWDVVLTEQGVMVIEGNNCSDVNLLQVHRPLLKDHKVRDFYKYHGIIKN